MCDPIIGNEMDEAFEARQKAKQYQLIIRVAGDRIFKHGVLHCFGDSLAIIANTGFDVYLVKKLVSSPEQEPQ